MLDGSATRAARALPPSVRPDVVDAIDAAATPAGTRFVDLVRATPPLPVVIARATAIVN